MRPSRSPAGAGCYPLRVPAREIDYPSLLRDALRGILRTVLERIGADGFPGDHHLYVRFRSGYPGVQISRSLLAQYPEEMTVVLQHQFWDLVVEDDRFAVTLRFGGAPERVTVPFAAVTAFADPAAEFGLQITGEKPEVAPQVPPDLEPVPPSADDGSDRPPGEGGKVLRLDRFRKTT